MSEQPKDFVLTCAQKIEVELVARKIAAEAVQWVLPGGAIWLALTVFAGWILNNYWPHELAERAKAATEAVESQAKQFETFLSGASPEKLEKWPYSILCQFKAGPNEFRHGIFTVAHFTSDGSNSQNKSIVYRLPIVGNQARFDVIFSIETKAVTKVDPDGTGNEMLPGCMKDDEMKTIVRDGRAFSMPNFTLCMFDPGAAECNQPASTAGK